MYETLLYFFIYFTCMRGDTEKIKKTFPLNLQCSPEGKRKICDTIKDKINSSWTVAVIQHGPWSWTNSIIFIIITESRWTWIRCDVAHNEQLHFCTMYFINPKPSDVQLLLTRHVTKVHLLQKFLDPQKHALIDNILPTCGNLSRFSFTWKMCVQREMCIHFN
jgi:hypothetical protein